MKPIADLGLNFVAAVLAVTLAALAAGCVQDRRHTFLTIAPPVAAVASVTTNGEPVYAVPVEGGTMFTWGTDK